MPEQYHLHLPAFPQGFHIIDQYVHEAVKKWPAQGLCHIFIQHTSAALSINEGADPSVRTDMKNIFDRLVPENQAYYKHTDEGPDDIPAHAKAVLCGPALSIPITNGRLNMGAWQSIYLCEFRRSGGRRKIVITIMS